MQVPLDISYRNVEATDAIDRLIRSKMAKLEKICDYVISARVAVERRNQPRQTGNPYEVRIDIRVPPGHELVVRRVSIKRRERQEPLPAVIRRAFEAMSAQLEELVERQRGEVKLSPPAEMTALVEKVLPDEGYGFLRTLDDRQIYFHKNSILHGHFDELRVGSEVRFTEEMGVKGPQASTVELVKKPPGI